MYQVVLLNDDFTPVNFVIGLVKTVFRKDEVEASRITLEVHEKGAAVCGVYTHEIAETKCVEVHRRAGLAGHPLMATMEPET
jgi:ATP-dependent Clp protease adaptor protein ClpS